MPDLDLHALANSADLARPLLEKLGFLNGDDPTLPLWTVCLDGTVCVTTTVTVRASDEGDARRVALNRSDQLCIDDLEIVGDLDLSATSCLPQVEQ